MYNTEHLSKINKSTFFSNLNTGSFIDNTRWRLDQQQKEFGNMQNKVYNKEGQLFSPSNYGQIT
tara:strand:+ start:590 stop:781 length:192 start_codon:yes stop_codon:yes gene_type:complete